MSTLCHRPLTPRTCSSVGATKTGHVGGALRWRRNSTRMLQFFPLQLHIACSNLTLMLPVSGARIRQGTPKYDVAGKYEYICATDLDISWSVRACRRHAEPDESSGLVTSHAQWQICTLHWWPTVYRVAFAGLPSMVLFPSYQSTKTRQQAVVLRYCSPSAVRSTVGTRTKRYVPHRRQLAFGSASLCSLHRLG